MKTILFAVLLSSASIYAQTTVKKQTAANGDVKMTITNKEAGSTVSSTSTITKKELDESAPFYKAMADCKAHQIKHVDDDMAVEAQVHGLEKDKCKVTSKATVKAKVISVTTCLLTAENRKSVAKSGLEAYSKLMVDGKTCVIEPAGAPF